MKIWPEEIYEASKTNDKNQLIHKSPNIKVQNPK